LITIENQYNTALVYADAIDSGAEGLLRALCGSPLSQGSTIRVMPDVHAGKGCAVGTTMTIHDRVAPGLVGVDIGCGMTVLKVKGKKLELQKLDKLVHEKIPAGRSVRTAPHRFAEQAELEQLHCLKHIQRDKALCAVGTLGGGNHFIELDRGEDGAHWLIIHSGSRRLGVEVAGFYQKEAFRQCPEGTHFELAYAAGALMEDYLHDMKIVQEFAELNRRAMADELVKGMKLDVEERFSSIHNYIDLDAMILRKGAVSAQAGEKLIIPMNMRDGCLLCVGKGNPDWNSSAPHGAGRLMSRAEAKQSFTLSQYKKEMKGVYSTSIGRDTLDESPMAYKPMDAILAQIEPTVEVAERLRPVYNFKAGEE
jgi:RNA-splicing ligase RtcB